MSALGDRLRLHAKKRADARAVFHAERWWTYGELVVAAEALAARLALGAGDVVAVVIDRGIEAVIAVCAAALVDAVPAVIDPTDRELAARTVARLQPAVVLDRTLEPGPRPWEPIARPGGIAFIIFTSGSTADAKGVVWSETRARFDWLMPARPSEAPAGIAVPLCTAFGLQDVLRSLVHGHACALLDVPFPLGIARCAELGVDRIKLTPTHVEMLLASPVELPALRQILVGAAGLAPAKVKALAARFPAARVGRTYGLTESGAAAVIWLHQHPGRLHTVGQATGQRRITVRDRKGNVLPPRRWGEVVIDMPMWDATDGYFDPSRRFRNGTLWTGDRGKLDGRGFLQLGPRLAEILKIGGRSVSAPRIEEPLAGQGGVTELAIVGVPDKILGEVACCVFVPAPGANPAVLAESAPSRVRPDEVPRWYLPRHRLPRGRLGKLKRGVLATEARRWIESFTEVVAPDHRMFAAFALEGGFVVVDGGVDPWLGDASELPAFGRVIVLAQRPDVVPLAVGLIYPGGQVGPVSAGGATDALLGDFRGELVRLAGLLPGAKAKREPLVVDESAVSATLATWLQRSSDGTSR